MSDNPDNKDSKGSYPDDDTKQKPLIDPYATGTAHECSYDPYAQPVNSTANVSTNQQLDPYGMPILQSSTKANNDAPPAYQPIANTNSPQASPVSSRSNPYQNQPNPYASVTPSNDKNQDLPPAYKPIEGKPVPNIPHRPAPQPPSGGAINSNTPSNGGEPTGYMNNIPQQYPVQNTQPPIVQVQQVHQQQQQNGGVYYDPSQQQMFPVAGPAPTPMPAPAPATIVTTIIDIAGSFPDPNLLSNPLKPQYNDPEVLGSQTFDILPTPIPNHFEMFYQRRYLGDTSHLAALYGTRNPHMNQYKPGDTAVDLLAPQGHYPLPGTPYLSVLRPQHNIADLSVRLSEGKSDTKPASPKCSGRTCCCHGTIFVMWLLVILFIIICAASGIWALIGIVIGPLIGLVVAYAYVLSSACATVSRYRDGETFENVTFPVELARSDGKVFNIDDFSPAERKSPDLWKGYEMRVVEPKTTDVETIRHHINTIRREVPIFAFFVMASHIVRSGKNSRRVVTARKWVNIPIMAFNSYGESTDEFIQRIDDLSQQGSDILVTYKPSIHFKTGDENLTKKQYIAKLTKFIKDTYAYLDVLVDVTYAPFTQQPGLNHRWTRNIFAEARVVPHPKPRTSLENTTDVYPAKGTTSPLGKGPQQYILCSLLSCSLCWLSCFNSRHKQLRYKMHYDVQLPTYDSTQDIFLKYRNVLDLRTYIPLNGSNTDPYVQEWIEAGFTPAGWQSKSNRVNTGPLQGPQW